LVATFEAAWGCNPRPPSVFICGTLYPNMGEQNKRTIFERKVLNKLNELR
jgi:hypothetical protein